MAETVNNFFSKYLLFFYNTLCVSSVYIVNFKLEGYNCCSLLSTIPITQYSMWPEDTWTHCDLVTKTFKVMDFFLAKVVLDKLGQNDSH